MNPFFKINLTLRWRDLDAYGHVNNSNYLTLLEEARIAWFHSLSGPWRSADAEPLVARIEIDYRKSVAHPATLTVSIGLERVGTSSLTLTHEICDADSGVLYANAKTVLVWVNPLLAESTPVPEFVRAGLML